MHNSPTESSQRGACKCAVDEVRSAAISLYNLQSNFSSDKGNRWHTEEEEEEEEAWLRLAGWKEPSEVAHAVIIEEEEEEIEVEQGIETWSETTLEPAAMSFLF